MSLVRILRHPYRRGFEEQVSVLSWRTNPVIARLDRPGKLEGEINSAGYAYHDGV
jgi:hypothetical protein